MYALCTTVRGDPARLDPAIEYADGPARAAVEAARGNRGFAVLAGAGSGELLSASYWDTTESMRAAEADLTEINDHIAKMVNGAGNIERFEVTASFRHFIPARGAVVRLARFEVDPARADEAVSQTREETVPGLKGARGLSGFLQLMNRETGSGVGVAVWESREHAAEGWPLVEQLRARASDRVGIRFGQPETYTMIRTTTRID